MHCSLGAQVQILSPSENIFLRFFCRTIWVNIVQPLRPLSPPSCVANTSRWHLHTCCKLCRYRCLKKRPGYFSSKRLSPSAVSASRDETFQLHDGRLFSPKESTSHSYCSTFSYMVDPCPGPNHRPLPWTPWPTRPPASSSPSSFPHSS